MRNLEKVGGIAAIVEGIIYMVVFTFYGAFWNLPAKASPAEKMAYMASHQTQLTVINLIGYVLFGVLLAVLAVALLARLKNKTPALAQVATVFGVVWVGLVIASGMVANIGLGMVVKLQPGEPEQVRAAWLAINAVVEGMGGGNEVVGGMWVLLLSIAGLKGGALPRPLNALGLVVGVAGIATMYPATILMELFGAGQIVWFIWLGVTLVLSESTATLHTIHADGGQRSTL